ncbi:hypothetical protein [Rhizobium halophytocola]|uniref:Uncharacterized protein n=1 Tax=Rhizobium halophytocola TaxID=735519 RepID=A0ABS4DXX2_9HYPH|nr:hypothetical protein [Rhizobium halophytocola]MBP1850544.1 hypothetical protein [Rhizobium halophytocola]
MRMETARVLYLKARSVILSASPDYVRLYDPNAKLPQIGARHERSHLVTPIATLLRSCGPDDEDVLLNSRAYIEACVLMAEASFDQVRHLQQSVKDLQGERGSAEKPKDYAAQCAMACDKPAFRQWLSSVHGADTSDRERIATFIRDKLDIGSRAELNTDAEAADRWKALYADFEVWQRTGQ